MKILIVEDDYMQAGFLRDKLSKKFIACNISIIETEFKFRKSIDEIYLNPPDILIMDIMIRWSDPSETLQGFPKELEDEGIYRAGIRCIKLFRQNHQMIHIPIIIYSVLNREDIRDSLVDLKQPFVFITKSSDIGQITNAIRSFLPSLFSESIMQKYSIDMNPLEKLNNNNRLTAFISYSHQDSKYLKDLQRHFATLEMSIEFWDDSKINTGDNWYAEIQNALARSQICILLLSADFFNSKFIQQKELPHLLNKASSNGLKIVGVVLKPCLLEEYPQVNQYQLLNSPSKPISSLSITEKEKMWVNLVRQIKSLNSSQ